MFIHVLCVYRTGKKRKKKRTPQPKKEKTKKLPILTGKGLTAALLKTLRARLCVCVCFFGGKVWEAQLEKAYGALKSFPPSDTAQPFLVSRC